MARAARRRIRAVAWRQWLTVLVGAGVVAAMVLVAETARRDAERHLRAQVLTERVRAEGQALGSINWQGLAIIATGNRSSAAQAQVVRGGWAAWAALSVALTDLHAAEPGPAADRLKREAGALYASGLQALLASEKGDTDRVLQLDDSVLRPQLAAFDAYARRAATAQEKTANLASRRAAELYIGSLLVGVSLLLLLGQRLHRQRRQTLLAEAERALERRSEQRVRALIEHASDVITVLDRDLSVRWQSPSVAQLLGHDPERFLGRQLVDLVHPEDGPEVGRLLAAAVQRTGVVRLSARFRHAGGDWRHLEAIADNRLSDTSVQAVVLSLRDVTARQALEDELRHQAFHDSLTGLANRALFEDRLVHALASARRHRQPVAVLFLDLDDFKTINDSLGHASGRRTAARRGDPDRRRGTRRRHRRALRGRRVRRAGREPRETTANARTVAARLMETVAGPFTIAGRELRVSASISG